MADLVQEFIDGMAGGKPYKIRKAYSEQNGLLLYAVIEDVEMDLARVTFDCDGGMANIDTSEINYILLSSRALRRLAKLCDEASAIYEDWRDSAAYDAWSTAQDAETEERAASAIGRFRALVTDDYGPDEWRPKDCDNG